MKTRISLFCLLLSLALAPGCSLVARNAVIKGKLADLRNVPRIDPNDPNCSISSISAVSGSDGKKINVKLKADAFTLKMGENPCQVKCEKRPGPKGRLDNNILLPGELLGASRNYPINLDTGISGYILVNDIHILENKLPTYGSPNGQEGVCCLPDIRIGELVLSNLVAHFYFRHSELQLFRLPIEKNKEIMLGLSLLQRFKYVAIDNVKQAVEFSTVQSFPTPRQTSWSRYPFSIQADSDGDARIFVEIPIGGRNMPLVFDTGCQAALVTSEQIWKQTKERLHKTRMSIKTVYAPFAGGNIRSRTAVVKELRVGDRTTQNAYVCILPNENPLFKPADDQKGLLGMQCFDNTTLVLDFEREVMWVKND